MVTPMDSSETGGPAAPFALRLEIKHAKVSTKPEGNDPSQVRTSDWNAAHTATGIRWAWSSMLSTRWTGARR
jgi:hypothetical protein